MSGEVPGGNRPNYRAHAVRQWSRELGLAAEYFMSGSLFAH